MCVCVLVCQCVPVVLAMVCMRVLDADDANRVTNSRLCAHTRSKDADGPRDLYTDNHEYTQSKQFLSRLQPQPLYFLLL